MTGKEGGSAKYVAWAGYDYGATLYCTDTCIKCQRKFMHVWCDRKETLCDKCKVLEHDFACIQDELRYLEELRKRGKELKRGKRGITNDNQS